MECKWYQVCPMKRYYEKGKINAKWINNYCKDKWITCIRYQMEENGKYHPDWILPDGSVDEKLKNL
ncbi:MAG: uracil-DNA glycosylase [Spirochaetes bacterium]|nr:uracil-DNA glycosylase [Spirochaetota bacterium]